MPSTPPSYMVETTVILTTFGVGIVSNQRNGQERAIHPVLDQKLLVSSTRPPPYLYSRIAVLDQTIMWALWGVTIQISPPIIMNKALNNVKRTHDKVVPTLTASLPNHSIPQSGKTYLFGWFHQYRLISFHLVRLPSLVRLVIF